jgi:hypothetical protein
MIALFPALCALGFNEGLAKQYLQFSMAAYCSEESITNWSCENCGQADSNFTAVSGVFEKRRLGLTPTLQVSTFTPHIQDDMLLFFRRSSST